MTIHIGKYSISLVFYRTLSGGVEFNRDSDHWGFVTPFCVFTVINEEALREELEEDNWDGLCTDCGYEDCVCDHRNW